MSDLTVTIPEWLLRVFAWSGMVLALFLVAVVPRLCFDAAMWILDWIAQHTDHDSKAPDA